MKKELLLLNQIEVIHPNGKRQFTACGLWQNQAHNVLLPGFYKDADERYL